MSAILLIGGIAAMAWLLSLGRDWPHIAITTRRPLIDDFEPRQTAESMERARMDLVMSLSERRAR